MSNEHLANQIREAISGHGSWALKLKTAIKIGNSDHTPEVVRCDDKCDFGKWLNSTEMDVDLRQGAPYRVINRLHTEFHKCAADVLELAISDQRDQAKKLMDNEFRPQSEKLVRGLHKWRSELT